MSARRQLLTLALVIWMPLLVWWLALLPGGMSADSLNQWGQIKSGHWTSHHPVPDTAFVWLTSFGGWTPATTSLVQTAIVALALAFFVQVVITHLGGARSVKVAAVVLALLPLVGAFAVIVWKDVPETAALLALSALLLTAAQPDRPMPRNWWIALAATSLAAGLLRWNAGLTALVVGVVAAIALRGRTRWLAGAVVAVAGLAGTGVLLLIPHIAPVVGVQKIDSMAEQLGDLAVLAHDHPEDFSPADRAVLERVAPFPRWRYGGHSCDSVDPITYRVMRGDRHLAALDANAGQLSHLWRALAAKHPGAIVKARLCRSMLAWDPVDPSGHGILTVWPKVNPNHFGLHQQGPAPLRRLAKRVATASEWRWVQELFWRPASWILLTIVSAALCGLRQGWRTLLLVLAVPLGVVLSYAAAPAAQDARYTYAAVVLCQLATVGYLATAVQRRLLSRRRA